MNCIKTSMVCVAAATSAMFVAATPEVSNVTMTQSAGSRLVTITYKLTEDAVVTLDVLTNATPNAATGWASIGGKAVCNAQGAVWRKVTSADADGSGNYTIIWRPDKSWTDEFGNGFKIADGCAKAVVTAYALDNTPDYMVVDISSAAQPNTQRYYPAVDFLPGGLLGNDNYRKTMLVMRKIMAKDVTWTMGSTELETQRSSGSAGLVEQTHTVTLTNNFYIGVFPITQAQWGLVQTGRPLPSYFNNAGDRAMRPVEQVSFNEIRMSANSSSAAGDARDWPAAPYTGSFLDLLYAKTGIYFDLPSEAQWEFSARAGNGDTQWGDGSGIQNANLDGNLNNLARYYANPSSNTVADPSAGTTQDVGGTAIVGTYRPNKWGLYDMHGNVWEVCLDWYKEDIGDLNGQVCNDNTGGRRVRRGGAWNYYAGSCRSASRNSSLPTARQKDNGLRVVCTAGLK